MKTRNGITIEVGMQFDTLNSLDLKPQWEIVSIVNGRVRYKYLNHSIPSNNGTISPSELAEEWLRDTAFGFPAKKPEKKGFAKFMVDHGL